MGANRALYNDGDRPVVVVQIELPQSETTGDYYYRTYAPGLSLSQQDGVYFIDLTSLHRSIGRIMSSADVVVLKNICDPDFFPLIKQRKLQGNPTIYEIADDLFNLPRWNPVYSFYQSAENRRLLKRTACYCDGLQCASSELNRLYGHFNPENAVFKNQMTIIPPDRPSRDGEKKTLDIGWGGSHGHLQDIDAIRASLCGWLKTTKNAVLHLMCSATIWDLFDDVPKDRKIRYATGTIYDYYNFLRNIDIGIAPLVDTPFNRSRSDVKFLEYAINEVVPVAQDSMPYRETIQHGKTGYLFKDDNDFIGILDMLASDPKLITQTRKEAKRYVLKERLQRNHNEERMRFYQKFLNCRRNQNREKDEAVPLFYSLARQPNAEQQGRHLTLKFGDYESLLHNGLVELQVNNNPDNARSIFRTAAEYAPDEYLPSLMQYYCSPDSNVHVIEASRKNPLSIRSLIILGDISERKGNYLDSLQYFEKAAEIMPEYDIPYRRSADVLKKMGCNKEASELEHLASLFMIEE